MVRLYRSARTHFISLSGWFPPDLFITDCSYPSARSPDLFSNLCEMKARYPIVVISPDAKALRERVAHQWTNLKIVIIPEPFNPTELADTYRANFDEAFLKPISPSNEPLHQ